MRSLRSLLQSTLTEKKVKCIDNKKESDSEPRDIKRVNSEKKSSGFICRTDAHLINLGVIWTLTEDLKQGIWKELRGLTAERGIPLSRPGEIYYFHIITVSFIRYCHRKSVAWVTGPQSEAITSNQNGRPSTVQTPSMRFSLWYDL